MNELAMAFLIAAAVVTAVGAVPWALSRCMPDHLSPELRAAGLTARLRTEGLEAELQREYWPHKAPERRLSIPAAHRAVQRHRDCDAGECPHKQAALQVLVQSGRVVLDPRRSY